ncbi:MAG: glycine--tRNA ligase [Planctomycetes bacterium]|nr:glycine--tRNA ligase [Planctomycetota bacterium]
MTKSMEDIVALCKRRGFIFPASEIYGGINGFWDFGPLGIELKNNLRDAWWHDMVRCPPAGPDGEMLSIVGLDSSIIQNPKVWEASGHVGGFNDPMQTCRQCKKLFRADHVEEMVLESEWYQELSQIWPPKKIPSLDGLRHWARKNGKKSAPGLALVRDTNNVLQELEKIIKSTDDPGDVWASSNVLFGADCQIWPQDGVCPNCGGDLTEQRDFNLMFETHAGAVRDDANKVYLRPETAQGIFLNFKNVLDTSRVKVPFGIAQIGKAFRNEVTPRNYIFRSREFEQMEMEFFCHESEAKKLYEFWVQTRLDWWKSLGISSENLQRRDHDADELSHYSTACADIEYRYPFTAPGFGELEGIAHRGNYDLTQHQEHSGAKLAYFDQEKNERYLPHVIEPAAGLSRGVLVLLCEAYTPDPDRPSKVYMKFHPRMAPIKAAIFPLVAKEGMPEVAQKLYQELRTKYAVQLDIKQNIGKRYARMDEAGTPYCFTIDGQTLEDDTVTVRERDTLSQERINISQVATYLAEQIG